MRTPVRLDHLVVALLAAGAGAAVTWLSVGGAAPAPAPPVRASSAAPSLCPPPRFVTAATPEIGPWRALLREELAAFRPGARDRDPAAATHDAPTPGWQQAAAAVETALRAGVWTDADRDHLHAHLGDLSERERTRLVRAVIVATNAGTLRLDGDGPPL